MRVTDTTSRWGTPGGSGARGGSGAPDDDDTILRRGTSLGRYVLLDLLGRGGMGAVYSAWDTQLERRVALKILRAATSEAHALRVLAEARALAQLRHPNVVGVHDVGEAREMVFLAMELVEGTSLRAWAQAGRDRADLVALLVQVARGLAAVHRAGLLHRDVKPGNIVVDSTAAQPKAIVVDFGLATPLPTARTDGDERSERSEPTLPWAGTPPYMAPECFEDLGGPASDQWSFALSCAELLEGRRPGRDAASTGRLTFAPARLREVVARGLRSDPGQRWPDLDAMADAMEAAMRPVAGRGRWLGLAAIGALGIGFVAFRDRADPCVAEAREHREAAWSEAIAARASARLQTIDAAVAERFVRDADAWANTWESSFAGVCRQESPHPATLACLHDGLHTVGLVAELAAEGEGPDATLYAVSGVLPRLPDPAWCTGPQMEARPQPGAEDGLRFTAAKQLLARAAANELLGRLADAATLADEAWRSSGDAPPILRAPIAQRRASIAQRRGELEQAAASAREGLGLAAEAKDDWLAATIALDHAETLTVLGRVDALRDHLVHADAAVKRAGSPPALRARLHAARGRFHEIALDAEATLAEHTAALELRREFLPGSIYEADSLVNIAAAQGGLGDLDAAVAAADAALARYRELLGERHPTVGHACVVRGIIDQRRGAPGDAARTLQGCVEILETTLGPQSKELALALTVVGMIEAGRADYPAARAAFERAVAIRIPVLGADHPETGIAHANLGNLLAAMGDAGAREHLERARDITVAVHGEESPRLGGIMSGLGALAADAGDLAAAREYLGRALAIHEAAMGAENPGLVVGLLNLGEIQAKLGEAAARATYERAGALIARTGVAGHPLQPLVDVGLGELLADAGDVAEAERRFDAAVVAMTDAEPVPGARAEARFGRARIWARETARVGAAIREAEVARAELGDGDDDELAGAIDGWLSAQGR